MALAQVNGTWIGTNTFDTWSDARNWSSNPLYPDGHGEATLQMATPVTARPQVDVDVSLSRLILNNPVSFDIESRFTPNPHRINMVGAGVVELRQSPPIPPSHNVGFFNDGGHYLDVLGGTTGVTITGDGGRAHLGSTYNNFTGGLTVSGGATVMYRNDVALGATGQPVTLDRGRLTTDTSGLAFARPMTLAAGGGTLETVGLLTLNNLLSGPGGLTLDQGYTTSSISPRFALTGTAGYTGATTVNAGTLTISGTGRSRRARG